MWIDSNNYRLFCKVTACLLESPERRTESIDAATQSKDAEPSKNLFGGDGAAGVRFGKEHHESM